MRALATLLLLGVLAAGCTGGDEVDPVASASASVDPSATASSDVDPFATAVPSPSDPPVATDRPTDPVSVAPEPPEPGDEPRDTAAPSTTPRPTVAPAPSTATTTDTSAEGEVVWTATVEEFGDCTAYEDGRMTCTDREFPGPWTDCGQHPSFCFEGGAPDREG